MFTLVDYEYKDLYWKSHIDKRLKIIVVDFIGYGRPTYELIEGNYKKYLGKIYLDTKNNEYYILKKINPYQIGWVLTKNENEFTIFKNSNIEWENFELEESLCSETELRFGSCEASSLKIKIHNNFIPLKDKWMIVTETLEGHTDSPFQFGIYKVFSDIPTADRLYRNVTAYDKMYEIINASAINWYNTILPDKKSKVTMKQFRTSFISYFGLEQEETTLANDDMIVEKTIQVGENIEIDNEEEQVSILRESSLSGKDIINAICEINGCFGHIRRDGKFHYIYLNQDIMGLYPSNTLFPDHAPDYLPQADTGHLYPQTPKSTRIGNGTYISADYEDFICRKINKVQIREKENDVGGQFPEEKQENENAYIIEDNFLVYGKSVEDLKEIAKNILEKVKDIVYRPFSAECVGNPCLEVGDPVRLSTRYELIESYILKRTLKGIQDLRDSYSAEGEEYRSEKVNSVGRSIVQLKGRTNTLVRKVEETRSEIKNVESGLSSRITQLVDSISMSITNGDKEASVTLHIKDGETEYNVVSDKIDFTGLVSFKNLETRGQTIINGGNITTGTINCDLLNGGKIKGQLFEGGRITGSKIEADTAYYLIDPDFEDKYRIAYIKSDNTSDTNLRFGRLSKNDYTESYNYIEFRDISQDKEFHIYSGKALVHCSIETGAIYPNENITFLSEGKTNGVRTYGPNGLIHYMIGYNPKERYTYVGLPADEENTSTRLRGNTVVLSTAGSVTTSDERLKNSFKTLDEFDCVYMDIKPCAFKYNNGTSGRYHFGAKAQNVKEAFQTHGYTMRDFGGFVQMKDNPENEDYCGIEDPMGLIYTEFTMWNMHMIQNLIKEKEEQKRKIETMQSEIDSLKGTVSFLLERIGGIDDLR